MNQELIKYIKDGVHISKLRSGYKVFTPKTQFFNIENLEELTPEKFEEELQKIELNKRAEAEKQLSEQVLLKQSIPNVNNTENLSWEYFKTLLDIEPISTFVLKNGTEIPVRNKCLLRLNNESEFEVYLHSMYVKNKKQPGSNEIGFIFVITKTLRVYSISELKKITKEFIVL